MRSHAPAAALVLALAAAAPARAEGVDTLLEQTRRHMAALRYEDALELLERALAAGKSRPGRMREIYRLAGELAAGLGRAEAAEDYFRRLLALDPGFALPEGSSPKLTAPLAAARAYVSEHGALELHYEVTRREVILIVDRDPVSMVHGARARYRAGGRAGAAEARGRGRVPVEIAGRERAEVVLAALDRYGNELAVLGSEKVPIRVGAREPAADRPIYARWTTWAGAALVASLAGGGFALGAADAQSDLDALNRRAAEEPFEHDFARARAIQNRGDRYALLANVSFGAAAITGAAAVALLTYEWWNRGETSASVSAAPTAGGAFAFGLRLRY